VKWGVLPSAGGDDHLSVAAELDVPVVSSVEEADHLVHVGSDASLAHLALDAGPERPILHVPTDGSDLLRMFGPATPQDRLAHGSPYPIELLNATSEVGSHPIVGHAVASGTGRLPGFLAGRRDVTIRRPGRDDRLVAAGIIVANAQHIDRLTVAPRAALMDGRFDVQVVTGGAVERLRIRRAMARGLHLVRASVHRRSVEAVSFDLPAGWSLTCDGVPAAGRSWTVAVAPAAAMLWV
jgi:hypothetical protein